MFVRGFPQFNRRWKGTEQKGAQGRLLSIAEGCSFPFCRTLVSLPTAHCCKRKSAFVTSVAAWAGKLRPVQFRISAANAPVAAGKAVYSIFQGAWFGWGTGRGNGDALYTNR